MENKENSGFTVNVNSQGNFIAQTINIAGDVHISGSSAQTPTYTDEQVVRAITAICGDGRPLDAKRKWAAVHWYLRWAAGYPMNPHDFCERINALPLPEDLPYKCEYNNIRALSTLSFMNQDPRQMDKVKPSKADEPLFMQCREVVMALEQELKNVRR
ncbi:MAG: hypothetical protein IJM43_02520 [Bacteroidaceae bacterium]|nr:hypothetical protein [Bacteroidaceae bacterium]